MDRHFIDSLRIAGATLSLLYVHGTGAGKNHDQIGMDGHLPHSFDTLNNLHVYPCPR